MTLYLSITDFLHEGNLIPRFSADINADNPIPLFNDKGIKSSAQCERLERLAERIKSSVEGFYREERVDAKPSDKV